jgi:hypothetical protein
MNRLLHPNARNAARNQICLHPNAHNAAHNQICPSKGATGESEAGLGFLASAASPAAGEKS